MASYLAYALRHVDKRAFLLDGVACMLTVQAGMMGAKDLLVAISFNAGAPATS